LIFWGEQWKSQTTPSRAQIARNIQLLLQTDYFNGLAEYNLTKPRYFMDIIYDDPDYPPQDQFEFWLRDFNKTGNRSLERLVLKCFDKRLVPIPN
jgi:hypothetical protein